MSEGKRILHYQHFTNVCIFIFRIRFQDPLLGETYVRLKNHFLLTTFNQC